MNKQVWPRVTKEQVKKLHELQPLQKKVNRFKREPAYRETNFDHVHKMLDLFAYVVKRFQIKDVDHDKVTALILSHDLGEVGMPFDVGAFEKANCEKTAEKKAKKEGLTIMALAAEHGAFLFDLTDEYEEQKTRESTLVKALDRLDAQMRIFGVGIHHEPTQDKADFAMKNLLSASEIFPEVAELVEQIRQQAKPEFEKKFKWNPEFVTPNLKKDTATRQPLNRQE